MMTTNELQVTIGAKLKMLRTAKKMTQHELALQCKFETASISRLEAGRLNPTLRTLSKICMALNEPIDVLFKPATHPKSHAGSGSVEVDR